VIVNTAITTVTNTSTGGAISSYAISPAAPAGLTFSTTTGQLSGTPTSTQSATNYTITATNAAGSATATFTLTVSSAAPAFSLSSSSETRVVTTAITGYTITSTGAPITSYSVVGTLPSGLAFSTSTGRITGTPTETRTATTYTIIGASASGETATATYRLRVTGDIGDTGPGGGKVFYVALTPFACGPTLAGTCSYLEAAPTTGASNWTDDVYAWSGNTNTAIGDADVRRTAVGTGYANTLAIVDQRPGGDTSGRAGTIARAYRGPNSLSDWYLPSQGELNQMCKWQRGQVWTSDATLCNNTGANNSGSGAEGFSSSLYWSSTEFSDNNAVLQSFINVIGAGTQSNNSKTLEYYLRPIRAF
jgi:hypothetical protein